MLHRQVARGAVTFAAAAWGPVRLQIPRLPHRRQRRHPGLGLLVLFVHLEGLARARQAKNVAPCRARREVDRINRPGGKQLLPRHHRIKLAQDGAHVGADEQNADGAVALTNGLVHRHVLPAKQAGAADVGLALVHQGIGRVLAVQQGLVGALAILLLERCGHADEVLPRARKNGRHRAHAVLGKAVHHFEIAIDGRPLERQHSLGFAVGARRLGHRELAGEIRLEQGKVPLGLLLRGFVKGLHQRAHLGRVLRGIVPREATKVFPEQAADDAHGGQQDHQQAEQGGCREFERHGMAGV